MRVAVKHFKKYKTLTIFGMLLLFTCSIKAQSITTGTVSGSPFCACTTINVSFTSDWFFNSGNVFTVQLSDTSGNFTTPVIIGTKMSIATSDTITCTLPCDALTGTRYRVRVISSDTNFTGTDNGVDFTVKSSVVSKATVSADPIICPGDPALFIATPTNGGASPNYQWKVNGVNVGTDTGVYMAPTLNNGDKVWVVMVADTLCSLPDSINSDTITMIVTTPIPASVYLFSIDSVICAGDPALFIAIPTGGGTSPSFQWKVNGGNVGIDSTIYVAPTMNNGDQVTVEMTSSASCATGSPTTSNSISIDVVLSITPTVSISASKTSICSGDLVTFTALPTGGGLTPSYQWKVNGINTGLDSSILVLSTLRNGDVITLAMTSSMTCASPVTATSNSITMSVTNSVTALVSISASPGETVCIGQSVNFTATPTNGGTTPTYQWQVNGVNAGANATTFTSTLNDGDVVTVIMTSNATCVMNSPATSNDITMIDSISLTPSVSLWPGPTVTICSGTLVSFIATSTNGGTVPMYQWQVNGVNAGAPTTSRNFASSTLNNGDVVKVILTSDMPCATPTTASDSTVIIVSSSIPVTVTSSTICVGETTTLTASGGTTYLWSPGSATTSSITVSPSSTTSYTVTGTTSGCTGTALSIVSVNTALAITATSASICAGGAATITASGGTTYSWNTGATGASITVSPATNTSYTVIGTTSGCTGTAQATVTITASLTITVNSPTICMGSIATLTANNGTTYNWSTTETTNPISVAPTVTTTYSVVGTSGTCTDTATSTVTVVTILPVTVNSVVICPGETATLTAAGAVNYSWNTGEIINPITVPSTPASYTVIGTSGGCSGTAIATVTIASATPVTISGNLLINACESTTLTAIPAGNSYSWGPGISCSDCQSVTVSPPSTQQYYVNYTDVNGCTDGDTVTVVVTTLNTYFLPTALSPNGDGVNDELHFHGRGVDSFTLKIFDRIGEKVFETSDMDKGWNGKLFGVPMNDGVFVYVLNIYFCNGEEVKTKGAITLVK